MKTTPKKRGIKNNLLDVASLIVFIVHPGKNW